MSASSYFPPGAVWQKIIQLILVLLLTEEAIRYSFLDGDFVGYAGTGRLVLNGENIYSYWLNTWPPFFAVFSVWITLLDNISPLGIRILWQLGSLLALYHSIQITVKIFNGKKLLLPFQKPAGDGEWSFTRKEVILPFFILLKYIIDNLSNIQINIYMLWICLLILDGYTRKKTLFPALLLALTISLKVYTIFFFAYFIFKREWKLCSYTFLFLALFNLVPFLVFGPEQAMAYYIHWGKAIANGFPDLHHKNQSFFAMIWRLTVDEDPGIGWQINLLSIPFETSKKVVYLLLAVAAIWPAWLMRNKNTDLNSPALRPEFAFFIAIIPLLSPLAWKAYFIFLWPAFYLVYQYLFREEGGKSRMVYVAWFLSLFLFVFTSDIFVGPYFSDVMEVFSGITAGSILCLLLLLKMRVDYTKRTYPRIEN